MSVWFVIPSKRPAAEAQACINRWRSKGYKVAIGRDMGDAPVQCDLMLVWRRYPGYAKAVNELIRQTVRPSMQGDWLECHGAGDPEAQWFVTGGDDTDPDPNHTPEEIARECEEHFMALAWERFKEEMKHDPLSVCHYSGPAAFFSTFGVMQPTGDRFAKGSIDRIAGSPWIGREFALRVNGGQGPYWPEYTHMFVDEEIMEVAEKLGVFWQRPDLIHLHHHFMRESDALDSRAVHKPIPAHLIEANSAAHWDKYQMLFRRRKAAGFPGHEPVACEVGA